MELCTVVQVRRRQPEWAPHPQQQQGNNKQADSTADSDSGKVAQQQPQDPLAAAEDFLPLQAADVQQSAAAIAAVAPQQEAGSGHGAEDIGSSQAADNGAAALPSAYGAAVVDGVPIADVSTSNGASARSTDNGASTLAQQQQQQQTAEVHAVTALEAGSSTAQQLAARVDVRVTLNVPPALRVVPGPLLGYAGEHTPALNR
jgi:hypothetical protein